MDNQLKNLILQTTQSSNIADIDEIQTLWSGYGHIYRIELSGGNPGSVIVKDIKFPKQNSRKPDISHQRKLKSYKVETHWYTNWSQRCTAYSRIPACLATEQHSDRMLLVLEDLNAAGFSCRSRGASWVEIESCISWLAHFHATFLNEEPVGLWKKGTYWHLDTRPDELKRLNDKKLKSAAATIDSKLNNCTYKTIVHGDAKIENFCFSKDGKNCAAVDFQYTGGGCGMKDLAYFTGSCLCEEESESLEEQILDQYFTTLTCALAKLDKGIDLNKLESEWRSLYHVAWVDFHRFLKGWMSGHWDKSSYSERLSSSVIDTLS